MDEDDVIAQQGSDGLFGGLFDGMFGGGLFDTAAGLLQDCQSNCTISFIGKPEERLRCLELCSRPRVIQAQAAAGIPAKKLLIYGGLAFGAYMIFKD